MARYEIEKYRTIEATLDLANDYAPPIRLNAGDLDGRVLKFNITDGGNDVDDLNGLSARLTWNRDPTDPNSGGGFTDMTKTAGTDKTRHAWCSNHGHCPNTDGFRNGAVSDIRITVCFSKAGKVQTFWRIDRGNVPFVLCFCDTNPKIDTVTGHRCHHCPFCF